MTALRRLATGDVRRRCDDVTCKLQVVAARGRLGPTLGDLQNVHFTGLQQKLAVQLL